MNEAAILKALSNVEDPDLKKDLVTLNMIQKLKIEGNKVSFDLVLTTPACPMKEMLHNACVNAVKLLVNQEAEVDIHVTHNMKAPENSEIKGVKHIIAVASGKGGVGKSTVAAGLAMSLSKKGAKVGLLDADIYGPSVPTLFDIYDAPLVQKQEGVDMMIPHEKFGIKLLSIGFLTKRDQAIVWRGPMVSSAFKQFTRDVIWGNLDYLIIDLPPGTGDVQISLSQLNGVSGIVMVSTPQKMSTADVVRAIDMFTQPAINKPIIGMVQNLSYFTPPELPNNKYYLFGKDGAKDLAEERKIPFLGELPFQSNIQGLADTGQIEDEQFHSNFSEIADEVIKRVSILASTNG
jgi:ATP-binding protein involved in chromosome partitioning